ncbi:MAG TPA: glycosyltransferase family 1 protein [Lentimicrobium sp.]|nr:glycosyltransferase family 1 protein [Lentimicrobium sp.]
MRINKQKYNLILYKLFNPDRLFFNRYKVDLLHIPRQHSPAYLLKYPVIITMHDIQHFHFPEFFTSLERVHKAIRYHISFKEADHIIVSFNHVKNDIDKYYKEEKEKTSVCPVPLIDDWISSEPTSYEVLKKKYHITGTFILTPAATWQHKNHLAVLEALSILRSEGLNLFWIATGNKTSYFETINKRISELKLEDQVIFPGIVPDQDLKGLYYSTSLVVIPTFYEAGSGPLVEAMRYGVPVICSNVTSLPEMIGNPEFIFNPYNSLELASLIKQAVTDDDFVNRNLENSKKQIDLFRSMNYIKPFVKVYTETLEEFRLKKIHG